jgi:hypothetical protein
MPHSFKPTVEQDAVLGGGDLKIKAYAGAGPTPHGSAAAVRGIGDLRVLCVLNTADDCYGCSIISCVIAARFESGPGRR